MKKIMMIATILVAGLMFMPSVLAYSKGDYGEVTDNTNADSRIDDVTVTPVKTEEGKVSTLTFSSSSFNLLSRTEDRPYDGVAWVGIKVMYPSDVSDNTYDVYVNGEKIEIPAQNQHVTYYTDFFGITASNLKNAILNNKKLEYKVEFDWDRAEDKDDQIVYVIIDPMTVQLYEDHNKSTPVWTTEMAEEAKAEADASKTPVEPSEQKPEETSKDEGNPDTSDINLYMLFGLIAASGCGLAYTFKKRFN